jgi:superfamily I DNA/RNA helicase
MSWLVPPEDLTSDQLRAIEMPMNEHRVILGAPGSGKTLALLYRARHLCRDYGIAPDRFRIFVFTNVLKQYIQSGIRDLALPADCVLTLDDWCKRYYQEEMGGRLPWDQKNRCPDFDGIRRAVLQAHSRKPPLYEFVLVDEGQDLDSDCFELLKRVGKHVTVCVDQKQQIYDHGSTDEEIVRTLGLKRSNLTLLDAFRCCPYIVQVAAEFISEAAERAAFLNQARTAQTELQTPLFYEAEDFDDEKERLIEIIRERQVVDRSIAILFHLKKQVWGFAKALREAGLEVETWDRRDGSVLDFASGLPKVLTLHSAKGLTFDTVIMPRLVEMSFRRVSDARREKLLYVGITRATKWVYLSTVDGDAISELARLRELSTLQPSPVTMQSWSDSPTSEAPTPLGDKASGSSDDPLDLL